VKDVDKRRELLVSLIQRREPVASVVKRLATLGWDSPTDLAVLRSEDVVAALRKFLSGEMPAAELEEWANAIESREDVGFELGCEAVLKELIFRLANPVLEGPLTPGVAREIIKGLGLPP
jgi:hypothetical protein